MSLNTWPETERPREKLLRLGPAALSEAELLAILLQTGTRGRSANVSSGRMNACSACDDSDAPSPLTRMHVGLKCRRTSATSSGRASSPPHTTRRTRRNTAPRGRPPAR